jgi:hypothetical protein
MDEPDLRNRALRALAALSIAAVIVGNGEATELARVIASTDAATIIGSTPVSDRTLVSIRRDGGCPTVRSALDAALPTGVDVDALSILDDGTVVFSTDVSFDAAGVAADDEDLVAWSYGMVLMYFDASEAGLTAPGLDLDAAALDFAFFADDFETGTTSAWSATAP